MGWSEVVAQSALAAFTTASLVMPSSFITKEAVVAAAKAL